MTNYANKLTMQYDDAVELDLYGLVIADGNGVVLQVDGSMQHDIAVGARLTRDFLPLIGMDEDVARLRQSPGERLRMPKVSLGENDRLVNLTLYWATEKERYLLVAMESVDASAEMLPAIRLARTNRFLTEQLESQRRQFLAFYDQTPFYGVTLYPDGQVSASTAMLRNALGLGADEGGGHTEALLIQPILTALKDTGKWDELWLGKDAIGVMVKLLLANGERERFTIAACRITDADTGLREASVVLTKA